MPINTDNGIYALLISTGIISAGPYTREDENNDKKKHKDIAKLLDIQYWTTIVVYKDSKEVVKEIGVSSKDKIYSLIKKEI